METLFHYTTAAGLLGILESGSIWATDLRFLNDAEELVYARDTVLQVISDMDNPVRDPGHPAHQYGKAPIDIFDRYKERVVEGLSKAEFAVYVACFCEDGDLLSRWRGYGGDHGYSVELSEEVLEEAVRAVPVNPQAAGLRKVLYGPDGAEAIAKETIDYMAHFNLNHPGMKAHYATIVAGTKLAQVKHPGFAEEKEWRIVVGLSVEDESSSSDKFQRTYYRPTARAIVPFIKIPFDCKSIVGIRVGPGENAELRASSVRRLLATRGLKAQVTYSEVPFRS